MKEGYTEEDICAIYRKADENQDRIQLLQDLTLYSKDKIIAILEKYGYAVEKKKASKYKLSDEDFLILYNLGMNDAQIARKLKLNPTTVGHTRHRLGLPIMLNNTDKKIKFIELYNDGVPLTEIASKLEVANKTVWNWCEELELPTTKKKGRQ